MATPGEVSFSGLKRLPNLIKDSLTYGIVARIKHVY
jgi:hypothetical protein